MHSSFIYQLSSSAVAQRKTHIHVFKYITNPRNRQRRKCLRWRTLIWNGQSRCRRDGQNTGGSHRRSNVNASPTCMTAELADPSLGISIIPQYVLIMWLTIATSSKKLASHALCQWLRGSYTVFCVAGERSMLKMTSQSMLLSTTSIPSRQIKDGEHWAIDLVGLTIWVTDRMRRSVLMDGRERNGHHS